jgi:hypothetical protein
LRESISRRVSTMFLYLSLAKINGANAIQTAGDEARQELRQWYKELSENDSPAVWYAGAPPKIVSFAESAAGLKPSLNDISNIPKTST